MNEGYEGWVTIRAAAAITGKSTRTIWRLIKNADLDTGKSKANTLVNMPDVWRVLATAQPMGNPTHRASD